MFYILGKFYDRRRSFITHVKQSYGQFCIFRNLHVFGPWHETWVLGVNTHRYEGNMQIPWTLHLELQTDVNKMCYFTKCAKIVHFLDR